MMNEKGVCGGARHQLPIHVELNIGDADVIRGGSLHLNRSGTVAAPFAGELMMAQWERIELQALQCCADSPVEIDAAPAEILTVSPRRSNSSEFLLEQRY